MEGAPSFGCKLLSYNQKLLSVVVFIIEDFHE